MISKSWTKLLRSLQIKKYRQFHQSFLVEGAKSVQELLISDYRVTVVFCTAPFYEEHIRLFRLPGLEVQVVSADELERVGSRQTNNAAIAVAQTRPNVPLSVGDDEFALALDDVRDPGNVGTILRIADWYGITKIICSETTADVYNPKVIAASMGSFTRVTTYYGDLDFFLRTFPHPVYGAYLEGESVHRVSFSRAGIIVLGNESQGIRPGIAPVIGHQIHIPRYGHAESLNVGIAAAIICDNLRRVSK